MSENHDRSLRVWRALEVIKLFLTTMEKFEPYASGAEVLNGIVEPALADALQLCQSFGGAPERGRPCLELVKA